MLEVIKPRCEYKFNPIGIDVKVPRISWQLKSSLANTMQEAYRIQVPKEKPDFSVLVWDSGRVVSDRSIHVEYNGEALEACTRYYYRIMAWDNHGNSSPWSEVSFWEMALLEESDWEALWITSQNKENASEISECPYIRKDFTLKGRIKSARIYATALGLYRVYINGSPADDTLLNPGWTSYNKRLQYQTYDVTGHLTQGSNALGIILANGWYKGNLAWVKKKAVYGDKLSLLLQLVITYDNGEKEIIATDNTWKASTGPILMSEIYHGETYDARLELTG